MNQMNSRLDESLQQVNTQRLVLILVIVLTVLLIVGAALAYRNYLRIQELHRKLEESTKAKLDFFTAVSHEFRTPLTLIDGPLEKVLSGPLTADQRKSLEIATRNSAILRRFVGSILDFRKMESGKIQPHLMRLDLSCAVREWLGGLKEAAGNREIVINLPDECIIEADMRMLERVSEAESSAPSVLVVDDNKDIRDFVSSVLKDSYRILTAPDGQAALDKALKELPDLVVSDVMMPVMDGLELCRHLKEETATSHIPVILLTVKSLDEQRAEGYDSGADAYISKPFSEKVLLSRVSNLLRSREALKEHYLETGGSIRSSAKEDDFLGKMRRVIREHLSEPGLSVEWLGGELGLSRVQLFRKVKALTGYSPIEVIRITRLREARQLLQTTDKTISEVAYEVGFSSPSYFSKCYRELFGTLPTER